MGQLLLFFLLGLFFFWVYRSYERYQRHYYRADQFRNVSVSEHAIADSELGLFVALMAKVAKADGRIHELEAELISNTFTDISKAFGEPEHVRGLLKKIFNTEKQVKYNVDELCLRLRAKTGRDRQKRLMMMTFLINLAYVDGELSHAEEHLLHKIASFLEIGIDEINAIMQRFASSFRAAPPKSSLKEAYALLEVNETDAMDVIKKSYRRLVKKHHPDIMKAKGASEAYIQDATHKVQQINTAYEAVKKARQGS
jgi:DnaJ like chaperone protein